MAIVVLRLFLLYWKEMTQQSVELDFYFKFNYQVSNNLFVGRFFFINKCFVWSLAEENSISEFENINLEEFIRKKKRLIKK